MSWFMFTRSRLLEPPVQAIFAVDQDHLILLNLLQYSEASLLDRKTNEVSARSYEQEK